MKSFHLTLLGSLLTVAVSAQAEATANCTTFNWNQQPGYIANGTTQRVSAASTCQSQNSSQPCPITATGDIQTSFSFQASAPLNNAYWNGESFIHSLVLKAVNSSLQGVSWPDSIIGTIDTTQVLEPGMSGYLNFTNYVRCFEGTLGSCTGAAQDGSSLRACAPVSEPVRGANVIPIMAGTYSVAEINQSAVNRYPDPFAGLARGGGGANAVPRVGSSIVAATLALVIALWY